MPPLLPDLTNSVLLRATHGVDVMALAAVYSLAGSLIECALSGKREEQTLMVGLLRQCVLARAREIGVSPSQVLQAHQGLIRASVPVDQASGHGQPQSHASCALSGDLQAD